MQRLCRKEVTGGSIHRKNCGGLGLHAAIQKETGIVNRTKEKR